MRNKIFILLSIIFTMIIASMDATIMNTTMPRITKDLGHFELYAWSFVSYMIMGTITAPIAGRLSDLFGRKKIFATGIGIFIIGSLLCGFSQNMIQLILFRMIQGIGSGIMMPFPAIIAGDLFSIENRSKIQACFTAVWGISAILAPSFGALFVEYLSWRWIFYVNLPIGLISLLMLLPYKEDFHPKKTTIDYMGALMFALGISTILISCQIHDFQIPLGLIGILILIRFYFYEKSHSTPIISMSIFYHSTIRWINISGAIGCIALFGTSTYIPLFLQKVAHQSVFNSGFVLFGMSIGWMLVTIPIGKIIVKYGYRNLLIIGNLLLACSGLLLFLLQVHSPFWYVFVIMMIQGSGFGIVSTVSSISVQQLVDPSEKGSATAFLMFTRNMGAAIGVTLMGVLLTNAASFMQGIHHMFLFSLFGSIVAFFTTFLIRNHNIFQK
ncbi:MFS transporter [Bacillus thuringiensis]|uniref:MFS transporter n=1 Tax=Bacillus thuringiensis TaxID=1428 RepID=UPI00330B1D99|nr:MFS transporter [Bacillus cereus]